MTTDHRTCQREAIERMLANLAQQFAAAGDQSVNDIDARAREQAKQQSQAILRDIQYWETELEKVELALPGHHCGHDSDRDPKRVHDILKRRIHEIDFGHLDDWVRRFLNADCDPGRGRGALLLLRRCVEMNGSLGAARIREILSSRTDPGLFSYRRIALQPSDCNDVAAILRRLGGELGLTLTDRTLGQQLRAVTGRLCESLQTGSIVFLEIGGCDCLTQHDPTRLHWVVSDFWGQLLRDLDAASADLDDSVTILALVAFDGEPPDGALPDGRCCCIDDFRREHLLEVPLRHWTRNEVWEWLTRRGMPGHPPANQKALRDLIMSITGGVPDRTENELLKRCAAL